MNLPGTELRVKLKIRVVIITMVGPASRQPEGHCPQLRQGWLHTPLGCKALVVTELSTARVRRADYMIMLSFPVSLHCPMVLPSLPGFVQPMLARNINEFWFATMEIMVGA